MLVKYLGASDVQVNWGCGNDPRKVPLKIGEVYIVEDKDVHDWHTNITLRGIPGKFNDVAFEYLPEV